MKIIICLLCIFNFSNIFANDNIDSLVLQIKQAPANQKRILINQLKLQLRKINRHKRETVISNLKNMHRKHQYKYKINNMIHKNTQSHQNFTQYKKQKYHGQKY